MIDSNAATSLRQQVEPKTNPEIAKVLRKQTESERQKLETLILRDGIQDPVVVWEETGEILDGHNRVDIAAGNNADEAILEYAIEYVSLPDLDAAIEYVLERQEGKRNATPQDLSYSRGKLYDRRKNSHGGDRKSDKSSAQNAHLKPKGKAADEVADDSGVDQATVRRDAEYSRAVDDLTKVFGRDFQAHVLSGESKLSKSDVVMLAGELGKNDEVLYSAAELWAFGYTGTFKLAMLLARCRAECGPKTHDALWQPHEDDAKVRVSASQLDHLLKMPDDETAADLVTLVEIGAPDVHNGKPVKSVHAAHDIRKKERTERNLREQAEAIAANPLEFPMGKFRVIEADPPWALNSHERKSQHYQYPTQELEEIKAMGSKVIEAADDDAHLYLWAINPMLEEAFEVIRAWGFEFKTLITWVKPHFGTGHYFRGQTEHVLFAVRGSLPTLDNGTANLLQAPKGRHSEKPDAFYDLVEKSSPGPYLRLYARSQRDGWFSWGDQSQGEESEAS